MSNSGQRPYVVGLTGGAGSGKSVASRTFRSLGVPVIDTDQIAREVVEPGQPALHEIVAEFGNEILDARGSLDRRRMRDLVFADKNARRRLEAILHPRIGQRMDAILSSLDAPYAVVAIPLLVEAGWTDRVDRVLVMDTSEDAQIRRLMRRDNVNRDEARRMLAAQAPREERLAAADDVVDNSGTPEALVDQIERLHRRYLKAVGQAAP